MRFFLIGFMGSGKSFWGKRLASFTKIPFIDLDYYIESKEDKSIDAIFKLNGEEFFRTIERTYLEEIYANNKSCIIATGGGTPCFNNTMEWMKKNGITIYLHSDIDNIIKRLLKNPHRRPLLNNMPLDEIKPFVEKLLSKRESIYKESQYLVDVNQIDETKFAQIILNHV
jgi:shikimate kinase